MLYYYKLYSMLKDNGMLNRYSPKDILLYLMQIKKLKINDNWITSEIPVKIQKLLNKLRIQLEHIT